MKKRILRAVVAAATLAVGGLVGSAQPASAEAVSFVTGCTLVKSGWGPASCTFIGIGPIGDYQLTVVSGSADLYVNCNGRGFWVSTSGTIIPGASSGSFQRWGLTTNSCYAELYSYSTSATATVH